MIILSSASGNYNCRYASQDLIIDLRTCDLLLSGLHVERDEGQDPESQGEDHQHDHVQGKIILQVSYLLYWLLQYE